MRAARAIIFILAIVIIAYGIAMPFMPPDRSASIGVAILVLVATGLTFFAYRALLGKPAYRFGRKGDSGVTKRKTFLVDNDMIRFISWLSSFSSDWVLRQIPTDTGYIVLNPIPVPWSTITQIPSFLFLEVCGTRVFLNTDGSERARFPDSNWMFRFDIRQRSEKQIHIVAECRELAALDFFTELLEEMKPGASGGRPSIELPDLQSTLVKKDQQIVSAQISETASDENAGAGESVHSGSWPSLIGEFKNATDFIPLVPRLSLFLDTSPRLWKEDELPVKTETITKHLWIAIKFKQSGLTRETFEEESVNLLGFKVPVATLDDARKTLEFFEEKFRDNS